jgi:nucleotide-binding universal stress UspA family protein
VIKTVAEAHNVSLIVMSTHGRSGLLRLLYGSVAEAVLRGAHTPLMLIPIKGYPALD